MGKISHQGAESRKGIIPKAERETQTSNVPGPGTYFTLKYGVPEAAKTEYTFKRQVRNTAIKAPKPDYDGSAYYKLKNTCKKNIYLKGFSFRDTILHVSEDHHKKTFPGVGHYNSQSAFAKTTQAADAPSYTFSRQDLMSLDTI